MAGALLNFATTDSAAKALARTHATVDPFNSVPCSLLSSAEIYDYAARTGMLFPFYPNALKSASYEAHIGGKVIWWDEAGKRYERTIKRGDPLNLGPNSITYVQVEPVFRLPNYIAVRFNLRITHVHRGLLLGTGPLVDPGFHGKLLIPLHNLTASEYPLDTNQALIWIEFTKTTYAHVPTEAIASKERQFKQFPQAKLYLEPDEYLRKANAGNPIVSSIPTAIGDARRYARDAKRMVWSFGGIGIIALVLTVSSVLVGGYNLLHSSLSLSRAVKQDMVPVAAGTATANANIASAQVELDQLRVRVEKLEHELSVVKSGNPSQK